MSRLFCRGLPLRLTTVRGSAKRNNHERRSWPSLPFVTWKYSPPPSQCRPSIFDSFRNFSGDNRPAPRAIDPLRSTGTG